MRTETTKRAGVTAVVAAIALQVAPLSPAHALGRHTVDPLRVYEEAAANASCDLDWSLLGGIAGFVSDHGAINDASGRVTPTLIDFVEDPSLGPIIGPALDGLDGRRLVDDTDGGAIDGDLELDRATGPFQFLPATWMQFGTDGNGDGVADPHHFVDAAVSAADLLCTVGADRDQAGAITAYFGTDTWNDRVLREARELRQARARDVRTVARSVVLPTAADVDLVTVRNIVVNVEIADALEAMLAVAEADGIVLQGWGWRSHERQIELRAAHCPDIWESPSTACTPPTARPGHSRHEVGLAIDFFTTTGGPAAALHRGTDEFRWLQANAADFGFHNLESEPWHWSVDGH